MLEEPLVRLDALGRLAQREAAARLLHLATHALGVLRVHGSAGLLHVLVAHHQALVAEQGVQRVALHEHLARLHHHHHVELLLAALLLDELVPRHVLLLHLGAHVVHEVAGHGLVHLVGDAAFQLDVVSIQHKGTLDTGGEQVVHGKAAVGIVQVILLYNGPIDVLARGPDHSEDHVLFQGPKIELFEYRRVEHGDLQLDEHRRAEHWVIRRDILAVQLGKTL